MGRTFADRDAAVQDENLRSRGDLAAAVTRARPVTLAPGV
jgi:hypothetical protein